jgi:molybdopterin-containing oxidoreductase family iron-sulfur binding subunit
VLVLGDHTNPAYTAPNSGFAEALANVDVVVATSSHPDESSSAAKVLVLPCASTLEDWGDEEPQEGLHLVRQPGMLPLGNLPGVGDLLLALGRDGGGKPAPAAVDGAIAAPPAAIGFGPGTFREYLAARWKRDVFPAAAPAGGDFDAFWAQSVGDGFVDVRVALRAPDVTGTYAFSGAGAFDGAGDLYLLAYPHPFRGDGRYANQPWAQEVPDPMSGVVWDSWVELHPETAARLGIADGDLVEITTASGKIEVGAELTPAVRKDVLAVAFGQGHISGGRYANNVGANVAALVAAGGAGAAAWQSAKAAARATGAKAGKVSTFGADYDFGRDIGVVVDAAELAKVGDAPAEHPGALTAIHLLELDERLQAAGVESMYEGPEHPTYKFGMTVDVNACNGCGACAIACYAENNLAVVGKYKIAQGREMGWIRIGRYYGDDETSGVKDIRFVPMMCQHCSRAPCESVCPVLATYHTIDGLNAMIYNRCVGTRYCSNNCPYKARRFNYHSYTWPEPFNLQLNPDVTTRTMGVMEKCTFCIQRIRAVKSAYRNEAFTATVPDAALRQLPACVEACPAQALQFGNLNDAASVPSTTRKSARTYQLFAELNTESAVNYLGRATFHPVAKHHGEGAAYGEAAHGAAEGHAEPPQGAAPHGEAAGHAEPAAPATH